MRLVAAAVAGLCVAVSLGVAGSADGRQAATTLRLYDAKGIITTQVTLTDVIRNSARAGRSSLGIGTSLYFRLTTRGVSNCNELWRLLRRRGARTHDLFQYVAFEVDGHVYARIWVPYNQTASGCRHGIEVKLPKATATRLARLIR